MIFFQNQKADNDISNDPQSWGQWFRSMLWERPVQLLIIIITVLVLVIFIVKIFNITAKIILPGGTEIKTEDIQNGI